MEEKDLIKRLGFNISNNYMSKKFVRSEIRYLTGGWLEEFCFNEIATFLNNGIDDVVIGVILRNHEGTENEFDVMFTKDNSLYFVECKSLDQKYDKETEILYKIYALQQDFGLRIKSFLVSTSGHLIHSSGVLKTGLKKRAKQCNTEIIHPGEIIHFRDWISERILPSQSLF